ncbi:MAG: SDR family NAD(P)-dependent oxidoreductase [Vicingaceae bacterium]
MKQVFITGASKGLGKAIAEAHLKQGDLVVGISRTSTIESKNYQHIELDLNDFSSLSQFEFVFNPQADAYLLYNNAGILGEVKHLGNWSLDSLQSIMNVNVTAPLFLTNQFVRANCNEKQAKYVLHIGSGAGERPIDGWGQYCASKAALHMASRVFEEELKLNEAVSIKQLTISPGVIDTEMQAEIRQANEGHFSQLQRFKSLKEQNELKSAEKIADKIIRNFDKLFNQEEPIQLLSQYS